MLKIFARNKVALAGACFIAAMLALAVFAPAVATHDPASVDPSAILEGPSARHLFGTDALGRDLFSRIVYGARISLAIGFVAVGIAVSIGIAVGAIAGYYGGAVDATLMRLVDVMLCFPTLFLILAVVAFLDPSVVHIMAVIGATGWMGVARLVRAEVLTLRERDYVTASRVMGASGAWIIVRHLVPNAIGPVLVNATLGVGAAILIESSLSFLGIGVQPPTPSWGNILMDGKATIGVAWWLTLFPGACITLTVLAYNLAGEGLRDVFEPRLRRC